MAGQGFDEAPTVRLRVRRAGPLGVLHARQLRWPRPARIGWWLFLLPLAIFAWSSWRLRGVARAGGYVVAGFVLLVGVAAFSAPPPPPVTTAAPAPLVATTTPSASAIVPAPVVTPAPLPVVAPPTIPRPVTVAPRSTARSTYTTPARPRSTARVPAGGSSHGDTYTNVDGNQVQRPVAAASQPSGATAKCQDGTWSFSQHHSGTCSGHGGVARWL
jgi:hypothetical protein